MSQDLRDDVRELAEKAIRNSGAGSEGFRVSVTWIPMETDFGNAVCWFLLLTLPSHALGTPPLSVTAGPLMVKSVPAADEVADLVTQCLPKLRQQRREQDERAVADARAAIDQYRN